MNKKIIFYLIVVLHLFILSGCQKTPKEVKERMENYGENKQINEEITLEFCTTDELKNTDISGVLDKYNLSIQNKTDFTNIEEIAVLDMQNEYDCLGLKDEYVKLFGINNESIKSRTADDEGDEHIYESEDKKAGKYFALSENGFVSYISGISYDYTEDKVSDVETYKTFDTSLDDISGENITINGKDVLLSTICDKAVNWAEEHFKMKDMNYEVLEIYERNLKCEDETFPQVSLLLGVRYKGILLDPYVLDYGTHGANNEYTHEKIAYCNAEMNYDDENSFSFASLQRKYRLNAASAVEKVITPECALKIINKEFSGFGKIKVSDMCVTYALFPSVESVDNYENKNIYYKAGQKIEGRPVYAFLVNKENNDISDFGVTIVPEHYIYVDMLNGNITTNYQIEK